MCQRWLDGEGGASGFECFVQDIAALSGSGNSIDRIDKTGHFEPGNVRWVPPKGQSRIRKYNQHLSANGKTMSLARWCEELEIPYCRTYQRLVKGWPVPQALGFAPRTGVTLGRPKGRKDSVPRKPRGSSAQADSQTSSMSAYQL
jgi:hypothetical protein